MTKETFLKDVCKRKKKNVEENTIIESNLSMYYIGRMQ